MITELLMKKNGKILFGFFIILFCIAIIYGTKTMVNSLERETYKFELDGYALNTAKKSSKPDVYSFNKGTEYKFQKFNDNIVFNSDGNKLSVPDTSLIHYTNGSVKVLKNTVGMDLTKINDNIVFYYNIFANTVIEKDDSSYFINSINNEKTNFNILLIRIADDKYALMGKDIRLVMSDDEIVEMNDCLEFEYIDGSIVKIYNNEKYYKTISEDSILVVDKLSINLKDKSISKEGIKYVSLTNLVIDDRDNIDLVVNEEETKNIDISKSEVESNKNNNEESSNQNSGGEINNDNEESVEKVSYKIPSYNVTDMNVTALKIDAKIEITDEDQVITSNSEVSIVENATAKVIYQNSTEMGDTTILVSYGDLNPDTEYTMYVKANYKIESVDYEKNFVSKIFRTEALGVSFKKAYSTTSSIIIEVNKENYSKATYAELSIYDDSGNELTELPVSIKDKNYVQVTFNELLSNTEYIIKMHDIKYDNITVTEGYTEKKNYLTLKESPTIDSITYKVDKKNSNFNLIPGTISDPDYGIKSYRYEIYHAETEINEKEMLLSVVKDNLSQVDIKVDENVLYRGMNYTYRLVIEFYDNEKIVEYTKNLEGTMTMDGVKFPTIRFDESGSYVTWEQINGAIVVNDPYNTIVSSEFKIVYKNSIDVAKTLTLISDSKTGNIPISINNLRANETYSFEVYTKLNLQDGNESADMVYIGTVYVQTGKPNNFVADFSSSSAYNKAFAIDFRLKDEEGKSSILEAKTLSEITFTLYQGSTTNDKRQVYQRIMDANDDPYASTLKTNYYDTNAIIEPSFFNMKNVDFDQPTYTLEVSRAYDYTKYQNEIKIEKNVYTFSINKYVPDLPNDPNNAIIVNKILNKNANSYGGVFNDKLDPNIVVGYSVIPNYDNSSKTGIDLTYHVWVYNPQNDDFEIIPSFNKKTLFNKDGSISPYYFWLDYGTKNSYDTDTLRRGNTYYFSYETSIDSDNDGIGDIIYPTVVDENVILRSSEISPLKQASKFKMFPSISDNNTTTWKYIVEDVDNSLVNERLYAFIESKNVSSENILINSEEYNIIKFKNLVKNSSYTISSYELKNNKELPSYITQSSNYFYGINSLTGISYTVTTDNNKIIIKLNNYNANIELVSLIESIDVIITPLDTNLNSKIITNQSFEGDSLFINFLDISEYIGKEINIDIKAYLDSGETGFDITDPTAMQKSIPSGDGSYYYIENGELLSNSVVTNSKFNHLLDLENNKLTLSKNNDSTIELDISITSSGIVYNANEIILKKITSQTLLSSEKEVRFDTIIPGVSMLNDLDKINITPSLTNAILKAKISMAETALIQDNLVYIDLFSTNTNGSDVTFLQTYSDTIKPNFGPVTLDGLEPGKNYFVQLYSYVYNFKTEMYEKQYLYDIDEKIAGCKYPFHALNNVKVSNVITSFINTSYSNKTLKIKYDLDTVSGFDHIEYKLFKYENDKYIDTNISIADSTSFFEQMEINISASPSLGNKITFGGKYRIVISPVGYLYTNGVQNKLNLGTITSDFTIPNYEEPFIGVAAGKTTSSIYFRVSISDPSNVLYNGLYDVKLVDETSKVIAEFKNESINVINKKFEFGAQEYNLIEGEKYTFIVIAKADYSITSSNFKNIVANKSIIFADNVVLGTVTATENSENTKAIDIYFSDSYKLNSVDQVTYTISSISTGFYYSQTSSFDLQYDDANDVYIYTISLGDQIDNFVNSIYTITINFYTENKLVGQTELSYYYNETEESKEVEE